MKKYMEPVFKQTSPDKLEIKKGGGCIGCFGAPFFLAGLFVVLMSLQIIPVSNAAEIPWWAWILMLFMGLIFTGVGGGLIFGRNWIAIDKAKRRIWTAWGLLKPMKGAEYNIDNYHKVVVSYDAGDSDSPESFPVALKSDTGSKQLEMCSSNNYGNSFEQAKLLSAFLNIPLEDTTTDHAGTVKPEIIASGENLIIPETGNDISIPPEFMKCRINVENDTLFIGIPGPAFRKSNFIGLAIPLFILYFIGFPMLSFFNRTHTPQFVSIFFFGFIGVFFVILPILQMIKAFFNSQRSTVTVEVNKQGITITNLLATWNKKRFIPEADFIGIDYGTKESAISASMNMTGKDREVKSGGISNPHASPPWWITALQGLSRSKGINIKSKQGMFSFGAGLPDDEVYHLYTLVRHYLNQNKS